MSEHRAPPASIKAMDEETVTVAGYGVVFGGEDTYGESFSSDTDFMLDLVPAKMALYDHRLGDVKNRIGTVPNSSIKIDDYGMWVEAQLERSAEYVEAIIELVEAGKLGWSSGSAGHLTDRKGADITAWPIVEFSLTPTPAEPRTLGVEAIKSVVSDKNALRSILDESTAKVGENPTVVLADGESDADMSVDININIQNGEAKMSAEESVGVVETPTTPTTPTIDVDSLAAQIAAKAFEQFETKVSDAPASNILKPAAPVVLKTGLGDNWTKAMAHFVRTGDNGGIKASNDTDMNIGTAADGGDLVPVGHYDQIIARRDETRLSASLNVLNVPGVGTTVDVPIDNEADGEFVSTAEAVANDRDAPAVSKKALTLVKYTKRIELSVELLEDEDSNLMAFLADFVGRGMAKTHNNLLLTEVATNGTLFDTFASATAIAFGEPENMVSNDDLANYLDEDAAVGWVMRSATHWAIKSIVGSDRQYAGMDSGGNGRTLLGYPVEYSQKAAAIASTAKSVYFGNWRYVGFREAPGFTVLRDPYSKAAEGQLTLHYMFRTVYGVLQAEAVGYGAQAA